MAGRAMTMEMADGLRDVAKWIRAKDPLATNWVYCERAADLISMMTDMLAVLEWYAGDGSTYDGIDVGQRARAILAKAGTKLPESGA